MLKIKSHKKKYFSYLKGIIAEYYVMFFLYLKGYRLIKRRYRNYCGEIDLIMSKGKSLIAIEVKYRPNLNDGLFSITHKQKVRIISALELFSRNYHYINMRCDVCVVDRLGRIKHINNAFLD